MLRYLLDTNIVIHVLKPQWPPKLPHPWPPKLFHLAG